MEKKSVIVSFMLLVLLVVGASGAALYYYSQYKNAMFKAEHPDTEAKQVLEKIGKLIELPTDEEPTVATVRDAEQLRDQPFFAKAQNGYRVVLYTNARLAILYDEAANKLINVGSINVATDSAGVKQDPLEESFPTVSP